MSVIRGPIIWIATVGIVTLLCARAQDFESLLQDLILPSPTAVAAGVESPDAAAPAEEAAAAVGPAADESAEGAFVEPTNIPEDEFFSDPAPLGESPDAAPAEADADPSRQAEEAFSDAAADAEPVAASTVTEAEALLDPAIEEAAPSPAPAAGDLNFDDLLIAPVEPAPTDATADAAVSAEPEPEPVPVTDVEQTELSADAAESAPVAEAAASSPPALNPEAVVGDPALFAQQEEVRRQAREVEGRMNAERGLAALREGRYEEAIRDLQEAQAKLPVREANSALLAEIAVALPQAHLIKAEKAFERGDLKVAREALTAAKTTGADSRQFQALDRKVARAEAREAELRAKPVPVKQRPEIIARKKSIEELMREGKQYFDVRDYNAAEARFESVLVQDEYNLDAMRYLRRIDEIRYKIRSKEREATAADLVQKVREGWNPPTRAETVMPDAVVNRGAVEMQTSAQRLQEKMEKIIIPIIDFRQANINDVINYLREESVKQDKDGVGVNIILNPNVMSSPAAAPEPAPAPAADPFAAEGGGFDNFGGGFDDFAAPPVQDFAAPAPSAGVPTITLTLRRISLLDAIKYITEVARLKYRLEENVVMITPENMPTGRVITRLYPVQPSILDVIVEKEDTQQAAAGGFVELGAKNVTFKKSDVKDFFERAGVPFPQGTSITYNPTISQLIVANTPENLEVFERILARLNVIPNQVEIEARFVEISQDDLEELGFQWLLTDNFEIAQRKGPFGAAASERIQMNADPNGVTKGLRFFSRNSNTGTIEPVSRPQFGSGISPLGGIATFASVLTNPELTLVIQALSQHGGTDLLSAPRVTTRSGVNAQIQVVREILYPTEFETTQPQFNESGNVTTPPVVTPGSFEKRETGVILNVTPTVGPDGYTIDLVMVPEVSELVDWIQYGSTVSIPRSDPVTGLFSGDQTFVFNIPQPVFASRNVTTSIVIWDGQTVVMGGLIREDLVRVKDKIPFLGDIPLLGRLFRTEGEYSRKKNLLIFVTARLVDPAGKPINRGEIDAEAQGVAAAP